MGSGGCERAESDLPLDSSTPPSVIILILCHIYYIILRNMTTFIDYGFEGIFIRAPDGIFAGSSCKNGILGTAEAGPPKTIGGIP